MDESGNRFVRDTNGRRGSRRKSPAQVLQRGPGLERSRSFEQNAVDLQRQGRCYSGLLGQFTQLAGGGVSLGKLRRVELRDQLVDFFLLRGRKSGGGRRLSGGNPSRQRNRNAQQQPSQAAGGDRAECDRDVHHKSLKRPSNQSLGLGLVLEPIIRQRIALSHARPSHCQTACLNCLP